MCVGRCNRLFYVHMVVKREKREIALVTSSSRIGPAQSVTRGVWPRERGVAWTGSDTKGRSFLVNEWPRQTCVDGRETKEISKTV